MAERQEAPALPRETSCVAPGKSPRLSGAQGVVAGPGSLCGL